MWVELPVVFVDRTQQQIDEDYQNGIHEYPDSEYQLEWTSFRLDEITAFNEVAKKEFCTLRLANGETFRIDMSYQELKKIIKNAE